MRNVPTSGWQRKHDAIGAAALVLFARDGYERTSVDAIAAEAGVSKRTVYSHYGDKENLFLLVLRETYDAMRERVGTIVDRNLRDVNEVRPALTACIRQVVRTITRAPGCHAGYAHDGRRANRAAYGPEQKPGHSPHDPAPRRRHRHDQRPPHRYPHPRRRPQPAWRALLGRATFPVQAERWSRHGSHPRR